MRTDGGCQRGPPRRPSIIGAVTSELHNFTMANAGRRTRAPLVDGAAAHTVIVSTARRALAIAQDAAIARAWSTSSTSPRRFATNRLTRSESQHPWRASQSGLSPIAHDRGRPEGADHGRAMDWATEFLNAAYSRAAPSCARSRTCTSRSSRRAGSGSGGSAACTRTTSSRFTAPSAASASTRAARGADSSIASSSCASRSGCWARHHRGRDARARDRARVRHRHDAVAA